MGLAGAFVAAVNLARTIRLGLLFDPDPAWAVPKVFLGLLALAGTAAAGAVFAGAFLLWARTRSAHGELVPLPFSKAESLI